MRRAGELAVTPNVRVDILRLDDIQSHHAEELVQLREAVADIEANLPAVLNAISSMSGAARMVKRELDAFRAEFDESIRQLTDGARGRAARPDPGRRPRGPR